MKGSTIYVSQETRAKLLLLRINEGKKSIEELLLEMLEEYKKSKEEK